MLYSIVETAKANDLKVYDYLEYLIGELAKHAEDANHEFLKDLLPWSQAVQDKCKNLNSSVKVLIYEIADKTAVSFIVGFSCLITFTEKVDACFTGIKHKYTQVTKNSTIGRSPTYNIHQESCLRLFLSNAIFIVSRGH